MGKDREERERVHRIVSNEILKDKYTQDVGAKAVVERRVLENSDRIEQLRAVVKDVACDLQEIGQTTKGLTYRGSLTVHVFTSELLRVTEFVPLTVTGDLPPVLGDAALHALRNSYLSDTGRRLQKKRSGF